MIIRDMEPSDATQLREVYFQTRSEAFEWLHKDAIKQNDFDKDTEGERIWVAEINNKVVGFISVWEPENFIHHLFVLPQYFNQGIGSMLLSVCMQNIGRPAKLKCVSKNTTALKFYRAKGWQTVSVSNGPEGEYHLMEADETSQIATADLRF